MGQPADCELTDNWCDVANLTRCQLVIETRLRRGWLDGRWWSWNGYTEAVSCRCAHEKRVDEIGPSQTDHISSSGGLAGFHALLPTAAVRRHRRTRSDCLEQIKRFVRETQAPSRSGQLETPSSLYRLITAMMIITVTMMLVIIMIIVVAPATAAIINWQCRSFPTAGAFDSRSVSLIFGSWSGAHRYLNSCPD